MAGFSFIEAGSGGGIGVGFCNDITNAVIEEEIITSRRKYHNITEAKNGAGAVPIKTEKGWIHIAHGVKTQLPVYGMSYMYFRLILMIRQKLLPSLPDIL